MKRWLQHPLALILGGVLILVVSLAASGRLRLMPYPDSAGYRFELWPLGESLARTRTLGYPVFLKIAERFSPSLELLPTLHIAVHVLAVLAFWHALRRLGLPSWRASAVASMLLFAPIFRSTAQAILTDALATSLAVFALAFLLMVVANQRSWGAWLGLIVAVFLTYQVRPAYLFLMGFVPLTGLLLLLLREGRAGWAGKWQSLGLRLTASAVLPFLGFCLLRWFLVGHFGLVSFGGVNLIGIAGQFLTEQSAQELPAHLQPLAQKILAERDDRIASWSTKHNQPWTPGEFSGCFDTEGEKQFSYRRMTRLYVVTIVGLWRPVAWEMHPGDVVRANDELGEISVALIRQHPDVYAQWVVCALGYGVYREAASLLKWVGITLGIYLLARFVFRKHRVWPGAAEQRPASRQVFTALAVAAGVFFLMKISLVVLVEPPIPRYSHAAGLFLITLPAAFGFWWQDRRALALLASAPMAPGAALGAARFMAPGPKSRQPQS